MRYITSETTRAIQFFQTGHTVNVTVLNLATDALLSTTSGTATESTQVDGLYIWPISDLVTPLAAYTELAVVFEDATTGLQKVSKIVVHGYPQNIDVAVSSRASQASLDALNDITVADILAAALAGGDTVDQALSRIESIDELIQGGRDIDFVGNDALGWQRIERDTSGVEVARYNLFDEDGSRITSTVSAFIAAGHMIAKEVKI